MRALADMRRSAKEKELNALLLRRALLRRKYGGEKASRGLAGRRRDGAVLQPRVWGEVDTERTMNSNAPRARGRWNLNPRLIPLHLTV